MPSPMFAFFIAILLSLLLQTQAQLHNPLPNPLESVQNLTQIEAYLDRLLESMDPSRNPCSNFYEFACGNFKNVYGNNEIYLKNLAITMEQFINKTYLDQKKLPLPVKQAGQFFEKCIRAKLNWDAEVGNGRRLRAKMRKLQKMLGDIEFPILKPNQHIQYPHSKDFSAALAHLNLEEMLPTFVTIGIVSNWRNPHNPEQPYMLAIDQATLPIQEVGYSNTNLWTQMKGELLANMTKALEEYANFMGVKVEKAKLAEEATAMLQMEYQIGAKLKARNALRTNFSRMFNVFNVSGADSISSYLDFGELIKNYVPKWMDAKRVKKFIVTEPKALKDILAFIFDPKKVKPSTLVNYLFYRLLSANIEYLPKEDSKKFFPPNLFPFKYVIVTPNLKEMFQSKEEGEEEKEEKLLPVLAAMAHCVNANVKLFPWANGRAFLDAKLPSKEERNKFRARIRPMIADIQHEFENLLSQVKWMRNCTKMAALGKLRNLVINVGWPEIVENDEMLTEYYANLEWNRWMSYTEMVDSLQNHRRQKEFEKLFTAKDIDRSEFSESPVVSSAWHRVDLNSVTFTLSNFDSPTFNPNFPTSANYAKIGFVIGHEIAHLFDDHGIQWDGTGVLRNLLGYKSAKGFRNMADCIVDQYSQFEPIQGIHIDGQMTQSENIADNGALLAAFNAFRRRMALNGPEFRLPNEHLNVFNGDQFFFINFAQGWCQEQMNKSTLLMNLLIDTHSPAKYRVLGSIQNSAAFQAAFKCSADGIGHEAKKFCQIW